MFEFYFIMGLICGVICIFIADWKGRRAWRWFLVGFLLGVIGLIIAICMPTTEQYKEHLALKKGEKKRCPECAELINTKARKCRYCGETFGDFPDG